MSVADKATGDLENPVTEEMFTTGPYLEEFILKDEQRLRRVTRRFFELMSRMSIAAVAKLPRLSPPALVLLADQDRATNNDRTVQAFQTARPGHPRYPPCRSWNPVRRPRRDGEAHAFVDGGTLTMFAKQQAQRFVAGLDTPREVQRSTLLSKVIEPNATCDFRPASRFLGHQNGRGLSKGRADHRLRRSSCGDRPHARR